MSLSTPAFTHRMLWHSPTALLANTWLALAAGTLRLVYNTLLLDTTPSSLFQISTAAARDSPAAQQTAFQKIILYMQNAAASLPKMAPKSVTSILPSTASLCILKIIYFYDKSVCSPQPTSWMNAHSPAGWPQYKETQYKYTRQRMKGERNRGVRSTVKRGTKPNSPESCTSALISTALLCLVNQRPLWTARVLLRAFTYLFLYSILPQFVYH